MWATRWLWSTNHKDISTLYLALALWSGVYGAASSMVIRAELATPGHGVLAGDHQAYNTVVTSHGLIMIFFMLMPALIGSLGNGLVPLLVGAPEMAFPRLNSLSLWVLPAALGLLALGTIGEGGAGTGWTLYPPLSLYSSHGSPGTDATVVALQMAGVGSIAGALNLLTTIARMRPRSMGPHRVPLLPWALGTTAVLLLASLPVLAGALGMLEADRLVNGCFFEPEAGGDPVLYQHLFWFFGPTL
jgi:heme/copper-type cytochrome/quinol oxidase subunit 1